MAEKKIDKIVNLVLPSTSMADVYIKKIVFEGNPAESKRPLRFVAAFEQSNQVFQLITWDYDLLELIKKALNEKKICTITFVSSEYRGEVSHKLKELTITDKISSHANEMLEENHASNYNINTFKTITKFVQDKEYNMLLNELIYNNGNFFKWPAAKSIHHAFEGGLAQHTFNVASIAIDLANVYSQNVNINYDLLITGALLHDIGKLKEYDHLGNITLLGQMLSHLVLGIEMIDETCDKLGLDKNDFKMIQLKHIIASHHDKLEFGSPNRPLTIEAYIVAYSDSNDASLESAVETLDILNTNDVSTPQLGLDNGRICKLF